MSMTDKISLCVLSWKCHRTLENTLSSYRKNGLLDYVDEKIVYFQEISGKDITIAEKYGFQYFGSGDNIGIGRARRALAERAACGLMLIVENDHFLIEDIKKDTSLLDLSRKLLMEGTIDVMRLEHRRHSGQDFWAGDHVKGNEDKYPTHLLWSVCWLEDPDLIFPQQIKKICDKPVIYTASSAHADYTNKAALYRRRWFLETFKPFFDTDWIFFEQRVIEWWQKQNFIVAQGEGLFTHRELDSPYSLIKRLNMNPKLQRLRKRIASVKNRLMA